MGKTDKISERQLTVLIFMSLLSPLIRILPNASVFFAGKAAWLSPAAAWIAGRIVLAIVLALKKNAAPGDGLADMAIKSIGKGAGKAFCVLCALWLTFYAGFIARSAAERLLSAIFPNGNTGLLIAVTLIVAVMVASGNTKSLARTAEAFMPILLAVIIVVVLSASVDVRLENLLPVTYMDTGKILLGAIPIFDVIGLHIYFLFLFGYVEKPEGQKPKKFPWLLALALTAFAVTIVTLGTVSDKLSLRLQNSFFVIIRNIQLFGVIERIEAVVVAIWIITDFMMLASLLIIVSEIWKTVLGTKKRSLFVLPSGGLAAAAAFLIASNAFTLIRWSDFFIPAVNLVLTVAVVPLVLAVGKLRKKL